jgi:N-acetylglutamate synthase-like GNAT family acetyltransferase
MSKPTLRRARLRDADGLAECIEAAYSVYADRIADLPAVSTGIENAIRNHRVWVLEAEHRVVGGIVLVPHDSFLMLENVAVRPEAAGSGLGRTLVAQAEHDCLELGLNEIRLSTHVDMPENVAIYSRLGWVETGRSNNKVRMSKSI